MMPAPVLHEKPTSRRRRSKIERSAGGSWPCGAGCIGNTYVPGQYALKRPGERLAGPTRAGVACPQPTCTEPSGCSTPGGACDGGERAVAPGMGVAQYVNPVALGRRSLWLSEKESGR